MGGARFGVPSPGPVWGAYPQRTAPAGDAREHTWSMRQLRAWACDPGRLAAQRDPRLRALAKSIAAMQDFGILPREGQVLAALALLDERLVEMATGEGKTYATALAAAAWALLGAPVHVVTANDYLAARDAAALGGFYSRLGLRVAAIAATSQQDERRNGYAADVTYVTGKELAFDVMRDRLASPHDAPGAPRNRVEALLHTSSARVLRGQCVALLDEADQLLVDEAAMPLVLAHAGPAREEQAFLGDVMAGARQLREGEHYRLPAGAGRPRLLPAGREAIAGWPTRSRDPLHAHSQHVEDSAVLALQALHLLQPGHHYLLVDGRVELVDPVTGRTSPGRAWSRGLHQLVELKEGVSGTVAAAPIAQSTFQQVFGRYLRLGGISGTLREAARELRLLHGLALVRVPRHVPSRVRHEEIRLLPTSADLWQAAARRASGLAAGGRPVLVGVNTVAQVKAFSRELDRLGCVHAVLDARFETAEDKLIAQAGCTGRVTVATSLAGRGSDVQLEAAALQAGGLHVLLCQLNASRRTDRQFFGRAGRQGQAGSTEHWLAADFDGWPAWLSLAAVWLARHHPERAAMVLRLYQWSCSTIASKQRVTAARRAEESDRELPFSRGQVP